MHRLMTLLFCLFATTANGQKLDTLQFSGQASAWLLHSSSSGMQLHGGLRYIPQLNILHQRERYSITTEFSANLNGNASMRLPDSLQASGHSKPYRFWGRFAGDQYELRLGLQKINFGSASFLRPLMWFDRIDPRDPLQLTDGVWAALGRYYFLNNTNAWLWIIKPEPSPKTWEALSSDMRFPEWGGRFQYPLTMGELGITFHQRRATSIDNSLGWPEYDRIGESRLGLDGKWDLGPGLWFEAVWMHRHKPLPGFTNQWMLTLGTDYTFNIGNGLGVSVEQLFAANSDKMPAKDQWIAFTALSLNMPVTINDQVMGILYADYRSGSIYAFGSYKHQFEKIQLHCMLWWNPDQYLLPNQPESGNLFAGKGIQFMLVYHH